MSRYGEDRTRQALSEIAVSTRKWAPLNPKAYMRDPMSFDDYHELALDRLALPSTRLLPGHGRRWRHRDYAG